MNILVDTSVWSLALRRDTPSSRPEVSVLGQCLEGGDSIYTTGLVLQELLQGFQGPKQRNLILTKFSVLPSVMPTWKDYVDAADLRNKCRRQGLQIGTIDALLAQLCINNDLLMLTTDEDFLALARHCSLRLLKNL
jgi:predicted nucleic acid-binding protein